MRPIPGLCIPILGVVRLPHFRAVYQFMIVYLPV